MKFNPSTEYDSIVKSIDDLVDTNIRTYPLTQKARAVNSALDKAYNIIFNSVDSKSYDDPNFTKLPQGVFDIVLGERNISINKDSEGAEILKIHRVIAKNSDGNWYELKKKDIRDKDTQDIAYGTDTGQVSSYDWVGTSIVFDVIPEANITGGIKVFYQRNSDYVTEADTDKEPGLPATLQMYLVYYAAWKHAISKGLSNKLDLLREVEKMEGDIADFMSSQSVENNKRLTPFTVSAK